MPSSTPKLKKRELQKSGLHTSEKFYALLAEKCGYIDKDTARRFHLGFVKAVSHNLRTYGVCRIPHMGDFAVVWDKEKRIRAGNSYVMSPPQKMLRMYPSYEWQAYFRAMS